MAHRPPRQGDGEAPAEEDGNERAVAQALVSAMAGRDPAAMEVFYARYGPEVYGLLLAMVGDPGAAQELLQEIMWQAWRLAPRYDPRRASVRTWLHILVRSRVLDWRRRQARRPVATQDLEAVEVAGEGDPAERLVEAAEREAVRRAQEALPEVQRQAIALTFYRGLSQAEAAQALGVPLGTLKSRLRSALLRLREGVQEVPGKEVRP